MLTKELRSAAVTYLRAVTCLITTYTATHSGNTGTTGQFSTHDTAAMNLSSLQPQPWVLFPGGRQRVLTLGKSTR